MKHFLLTAVLLGATGLAAAQTLSFQQGLNGYTGTVDTNLREADRYTNYGAELEASIDASDDGGQSQALLRFDGLFGEGAGQIGAGWRIDSATLTLAITSGGSGIRFHEMLQPWDGATDTWDSLMDGIDADGTEAAAVPFLSVGAGDSNANIPGDELLVLDVTDVLRRQQAGLAPGLGWALLPFVPGGTNGVDFVTAEGFPTDARPLLTVQVSPVPETGTLALLLAGLVATAGAAHARRSGRC
jgi:hypothetical protein